MIYYGNVTFGYKYSFRVSAIIAKFVSSAYWLFVTFLAKNTKFFLASLCYLCYFGGSTTLCIQKNQ